jgi:hypothetical protein
MGQACFFKSLIRSTVKINDVRRSVIGSGAMLALSGNTHPSNNETTEEGQMRMSQKRGGFLINATLKTTSTSVLEFKLYVDAEVKTRRLCIYNTITRAYIHVKSDAD